MLKNAAFNGTYKNFGLLDYSWYIKYKTYLNDLLTGKTNKIYTFIKEDIDIKTEIKIYCFGNENRSFSFVSNFVLVTEKLISIISINNNIDLKKMIYSILIGGQCMIRLDRYVPKDNYITFYEDNTNNNIDFWLMIEDKQQRIKHLNIILNNNLWYYLGLINFDYQDKKKIYIMIKVKK